jgi:hypothetical protein
MDTLKRVLKSTNQPRGILLVLKKSAAAKQLPAPQPARSINRRGSRAGGAKQTADSLKRTLAIATTGN